MANGIFLSPGGCCGCSAGGTCHQACGCYLTDTLTATDSALGITATLSYNSVPKFFFDPEWSGTASYTYPGIGSCPARTVILTYFFYDCGISVFWNTVGSGGGGNACPLTGPWTPTSTFYYEMDLSVPSVSCGTFSAVSHISGAGSTDNPQGALYGVGVGTTVTITGTPANPADCAGGGLSLSRAIALPRAADTMASLRAIKACPYRLTGPGCGCSGAKCALRFRNPRGMLVGPRDCLECIETYPEG